MYGTAAQVSLQVGKYQAKMSSLAVWLSVGRFAPGIGNLSGQEMGEARFQKLVTMEPMTFSTQSTKLTGRVFASCLTKIAGKTRIEFHVFASDSWSASCAPFRLGR